MTITKYKTKIEAITVRGTLQKYYELIVSLMISLYHHVAVIHTDKESCDYIIKGVMQEIKNKIKISELKGTLHLTV